MADGISAGIALLLVSGLVAALMGGAESLWGSALLWLMSPAAAAVAAATASFRQRGGPGRMVAVAILALLAVVFVTGLLDYVSIMAMAGLPDRAIGSSPGWLWRRHIVVALLAVMGGALLGLMLGRRVAPRPKS